MNIIVYDLEWDSNGKKEIVEIGACKIALLDQKWCIFDKFQSFVQPKEHPYSNYCERFTKIPREIINQSEFFPGVYQEFVNWIGEEEHVFCSWGGSDSKIFAKNCKMNSLENIIHVNNDVQLQISKAINGNSNRVGLEKAIKALNIDHNAGEYHRADFDAEGTAKVMLEFIDDLDIKNNVKSTSRKKRRKENINSLIFSDKKQMAAWMENRLINLLEDLPTLVKKEILKDIEKWEDELKILKNKIEEIFKLFKPETDGEFYIWVKENYPSHSPILFKMYCEVDINEFSWRRHLYSLTFHKKEENVS
ncbi:sporulation inhibitor KapD [compost metagenome]